MRAASKHCAVRGADETASRFNPQLLFHSMKSYSTGQVGAAGEENSRGGLCSDALAKGQAGSQLATPLGDGLPTAAVKVKLPIRPAGPHELCRYQPVSKAS